MINFILFSYQISFSISICIFRIEHSKLWLVLENGEMALAALSMDGTLIDNYELRVQLRSPNWSEIGFSLLKNSLQTINGSEIYDYSRNDDEFEDFEFQGKVANFMQILPFNTIIFLTLICENFQF